MLIQESVRRWTDPIAGLFQGLCLPGCAQEVIGALLELAILAILPLLSKMLLHPLLHISDHGFKSHHIDMGTRLLDLGP